MSERRVAVIGMGCRFAGAKNPAELWNLMMLRESHSTSMEMRFPEFWEYYHPDSRAEGKFYNTRAFFLKDDIDLFDADFFHISYKEAKRMDYQQRMLLEVSYEALQDAGIEIRGSDAGIFIGAFMQDFLTNTMQKENYDNLSSQHATGSSIGMLASRLSYFYDVHGPSMAVDTACSSSLTALYLATESIKNGKCSTALCGGVNMMTEPGNFITLSKGGFLSPRSRSAAFGEDADGYARGEGIGVLVLKNWEDAVRDKDRILCEIVQVQVNHDGKKKGITYPNQQAQTILLQQVYENGCISIDDIGYVEAHGTGTRAGDKVEVEALHQVFGGRKEPLYIGSVKTNIGHTEAAAGSASVIKGILMLQHGLIPPSLHCGKKNSNIPFENYHIIPAEKEKTLKTAADGRFYIGINGFGFGGANAHVVIGSPEKEMEDKAGKKELASEGVYKKEKDIWPEYTLYLAANSMHSLKHLAGRYKYAMQCGELKNYSLEEICRSTAQRRSHDLPCRLAVTAKDIPQMAKQLTKFEREEADRQQMCKCSNKKYKKLLAVFSGMGIQTEDMGKDLYRNFAVFRNCFHACSQAYERNSGRSLEDVIRGEQVPEDFYRVGFLQSYNLAYQISLFTLLQSLGLKFDGCVGHSAGELAAFYCSGMLTLEETFRVSWHRGKCQELVQGKGKMLVCKLNRKKAEEICRQWEGKISLAVENGQNAVVLSGEYEVLEKLAEEWDGRFLNGSVAYHSIQMEEIKDVFCEKIGQSAAEKPKIPLYSTVYGRKMEQADYDGSYWWKNVRNTVEFYKTLQELKREECDAFVEIGTTPVLSHYIAQQFNDRDFTCITIQTKRQEGTETEKLYRGMMQAYVKHVPMDFKTNMASNRMLPLPAYTWDYKQLPVETSMRKSTDTKTYLGKRLAMPQEIWENRLNLVSHSWLAGHKIGKERYLPAAFYIAMLSEAGIRHIEDMEIKNPVVLDNIQDLILNLIRHTDGGLEVSAAGRTREDWQFVMRCRKSEKCKLHDNKVAALQRDELQWKQHISRKAVYHILKEKALCYEGIFCCIDEAWYKNGMACCRIEPVYGKRGEYAAILDAMLQTAALAGGQGTETSRREIMVPVSFEEIKLYESGKQKEGSLFTYAEVSEITPEEWSADISLYEEEGNRLAEFTKVHFKRKKKVEKTEREIYTQEWEKIEIPVSDTGRVQQNLYVYRAGNSWKEDIEQLLQLIKKRRPEDGPLLLVTENALKVSSSDTVENYWQAALWGAARCLRVERTDTPIYLLDTDSPEGVEQLLLHNGLPENEYELAMRGGMVYGSRIRKNAQSRQERTDREKRSEDTAVITGASGGVAFSYALYLAAKGIRHIVLFSRHRTEQLDVLEEVLGYYGVDCIYQQVDVTKWEQIQKCWEDLQDKKYRKKVVYHLAGYSKDCLAEDISLALLEEHMEPKMKGAMHLSKLVKASGDRLVLIGSVTALLGNPGQICYAAANMVLESFGEYAGHKITGFGALDTGMAVQSENIKKALKLQGIEQMDSREEIGCVEACTEDVCYAAKLDWHKLLRIRNVETDHKFKYVIPSREQEDDFWKAYYAANAAQREQMLIEEIQTIYAQTLGMREEEISPDRNTDTMGIDSLNATFISGRIQQRLNTGIMPNMISGPFTIRNMALRMSVEIERESEK